jgi:hypothetical protein
MKNREAKARELVRRMLDWARAAYARECLWNEMNWSPPSQFARNAVTLWEFIHECEKLVPELKAHDQPSKP